MFFIFSFPIESSVCWLTSFGSITCLGVCSAYQTSYYWGKLTPLCVRFSAQGTPYARIFSDWILHRYCECCHSYYEFIWASALLCLENPVSFLSFTTLELFWGFCLLFHKHPWVLAEGISCIIFLCLAFSWCLFVQMCGGYDNHSSDYHYDIQDAYFLIPQLIFLVVVLYIYSACPSQALTIPDLVSNAVVLFCQEWHNGILQLCNIWNEPSSLN